MHTHCLQYLIGVCVNKFLGCYRFAPQERTREIKFRVRLVFGWL